MTVSRSSAADRIFVDTSAFYAVADRDNQASPSARAFFSQLVAEQRQLVTTNFVLAELHALLIARANRHIALTVIQSLRHSSTLTIERASDIDELRAWEIVEQYDDKEFSFVDALSFAVMERLGIVHAFALDRHFVQYGWVVFQIDET